MEHVVHQEDMTVVHAEREMGGFDLGVQTYTGKIIPVEGYIQGAQGQFGLQQGV
jgi:hypothetical protein